MVIEAAAQAELCRLRRDIARIEGRQPEADCLALETFEAVPSLPAAGLRSHERARQERGARLGFGIGPLDAVLGGGLPLATLHEIRACESRNGGAASGFVLALVTRLTEAQGTPSILWVSEANTRRETGGLYAPGLARLGLDPASVVEVAARTESEALWAFEAALSCPGLGAAVCELREASLDLSATRRCVLRAREAGVTGFLIRLGSHVEPSAAELRFRLSPLPAGAIGGFAGGIGRAAWRLALEKNRNGPTGVFALEWNAHERCFAERGKGRRLANPQSLPAAPLHRPPAPLRLEEILPALRHAS